jgi:hypothetical protein
LATPEINSSGQVAFFGNLGGSSVTSLDDQGVWLANATEIRPVARVGTDGPLGPGVGPGVHFLRHNLFSPELNDSGDVSFGAAINQTPQYNGVWKTIGDGLQPVAMVRTDGALGPQLGPGVEFLPLMTTGYLLDSGDVVFRGSVNQNDSVQGGQSGIWQTNESGPQPQARVRTTDVLGPDLDDEYFTTFEQMAVGDDGSIFVDARLGSATVASTGDGLFQLTPQRVLLSRTGRDDALGPQLGADVSFAGYDSIHVSAGNQLIATAKIIGPGVDATNDAGVWLVSNAGIQPVARSGVDGQLGPQLGEGTVFAPSQPNPLQIRSAFQEVDGSGDQFAFVATFAGGGWTPDQAMGIWIGGGDDLSPIALTHVAGELGPSWGDDVFHRFSTLAMNDDGSLFFEADTGPADGSPPRTGLWQFANGDFVPLVSVGDVIDVETELGIQSEAISAIDWSPAEGVDREHGRLAVALSFAGGGRGLFLIVPPSSAALPGDLNGDGAVDAADYIFWRKLGSMDAEYDEWRANFGNSTGTGANATVPEPDALWLVIVTAIGWWRQRN